MTRTLPALLLSAVALTAHVGSNDVFFEGSAGHYPLSVAIRPPTVIPGIAEVEIRSLKPGIQSVTVVPYPLSGAASKYPPTPDRAKQSAADPQFYTASVWLMAFGSFQVRIDVDGPSGHGSLSVPIPAVALETKQMQPGLGWILALMMLLIVAGAVSILGAAAREATLPPTEIPGPKQRRKSRMAMLGGTAAMGAIILLGNWWWAAEAGGYRGHLYKQPTMDASLQNGAISLQLEQTPKPDDFLPDHGHLMHLFVVRMPEMDRIWHLHPSLAGNNEFRMPAPPLPAGNYKLFADIVHASGFPETPVGNLKLSHAIAGSALTGDDVEGFSPPLSRFDSRRLAYALPDGYQVVRPNRATPLIARQMQHLTFEVQDATGKPATDLEPYMGMAAHAEFISADASIFAHVHPSGTVPMASLGLVPGSGKMPGHDMAMMDLPAQFAFPYGFPKSGHYRMFIQIQRAGHPETAAFDFDVAPAQGR